MKVYPILHPSLGNITTHIAILCNKNGQKTMHRISYFQRQKQFFHTFVCCKKILLDIFFSKNVYSITISLFSLYISPSHLLQEFRSEKPDGFGMLLESFKNSVGTTLMIKCSKNMVFVNKIVLTYCEKKLF